jgi:LysM domain-containing protein
MFGRGQIYVAVTALVIVALALSTARPSRGASPEGLHVVQPGETLWSIATESYSGDPRAAVWRIEQRNGLMGGPLVPGTAVYLPP